MLADAMGLALRQQSGDARDVPLRIDIPTAQGTIVFQTTPELVRAGGGDRWKRPAHLLR